jgi:hypothetical protein
MPEVGREQPFAQEFHRALRVSVLGDSESVLDSFRICVQDLSPRLGAAVEDRHNASLHIPVIEESCVAKTSTECLGVRISSVLKERRLDTEQPSVVGYSQSLWAPRNILLDVRVPPTDDLSQGQLGVAEGLVKVVKQAFYLRLTSAQAIKETHRRTLSGLSGRGRFFFNPTRGQVKKATSSRQIAL